MIENDAIENVVAFTKVGIESLFNPESQDDVMETITIEN